MSRDPDLHALQELRTYPDVQVVRLERGQVLQYPGHYPLGVWVVLSGKLRLTPDDLALDADATPRILPALADLDRPAARGAVVERAADALFVPHSVAREDEAVRRLLQELR
ncbi:MAG TPA: hypothetical protein VFO11_11705 [Candidatus Polarisedimenticolaceae bacterium]|nr:hypothetical protein [Candidatus Polarisedimenticolaceae bacterium]